VVEEEQSIEGEGDGDVVSNCDVQVAAGDSVLEKTIAL
jgi:hypothetical protein